MQTFLLIVVAVLGLAVGSFLNVVIYRVPRDESLSHPRSHCPACGEPVRNRHNVPVLSWLLLRGRCADCRTPISVRYPLVEAGTAVLFVAVAARFGFSWELPAYLYLAAISVALAAIDLDCRRLPDSIVLPSYFITAFLIAPAVLAERSWSTVGRGLIAAAALFVTYWVMHLVGGMGGGDLALAPLLGFYLGWLSWGTVAVGAFAAFVMGGLVGGTLLLLRRANRKTRIPFGPYMLAGAFLAVFAGAPIAQWYSSLLVPTV